MLAGVRCCSLLLFLLGFSVAVVLPVQAQVNGVPPSVTSIGFGGRVINGVPASVTSFGPDGYNSRWSVFGNCCANFFLPANPNPLLLSEGHHRHKKDGASLVGVLEPVFVPFAVPYAPEEDDDALDADAASPETPDSSIRPARHGDSAPMAEAEENNEEDSAAIQPLTVLVFKDTHQSGVLNYAIVGDTLFDFDEGRARRIPLAELDLPATLKANDDRGVDFQIPAGAKGH